MSDDLETRLKQFRLLELPGQMPMMHMGTYYLVEDLWKEVERLRMELRAKVQDDGAVISGLQGKIEQLIAEVERLRGELVKATSGPRDDEEIARLRVERDGLRRDLEIWRRNGGDDLMRAEIERLHAERDKLLLDNKLLRESRAEISKNLRDEIERLRDDVKTEREGWERASAEIERLRGELNELRKKANILDAMWVASEKECTELLTTLKEIAAMAGMTTSDMKYEMERHQCIISLALAAIAKAEKRNV